MNDSPTNWTTAGHGVHESVDLFADTSAIAAGINLPPGFRAVAEDADFGPAISQGMAKVEKALRAAVANSDPLIDATSSHLVEAGGKRVRPLLVILTSLLGEGVTAETIKAATIVELTHLATLYHDDVMDSASYRRGAPTAHEVWGNSTAILTGDLIFARASVIGSELGAKAVELQAKTFERLCLGQLHETVGPRDGEDPVAHYLDVIGDKTASLIATSGVFGALFGGASEHVDVMRDYGEKVGVAFQLADDVIDVTGAQVRSGKTPGTDLREGVPTLPVLLLRDASAAGDTSATEVLTLVDGDLSSDEDLARTVAALAAHEVTQKSWAVARQWSADAIEALAPLPEGPVKSSLAAFAHAVVSREN